MWKNQGSWNFFHTKLIPNSSKLWVDSFEKYKKLYPFISVEARYMDILIKEK